MKRPPNKQRSRRLQKKLHVGEFQQLGFGFGSFYTDGDISNDGHESLLARFLAAVIAPRQLEMSGSMYGAYIMARKGSVTEEDRKAVRIWLLMQPEMDSVRIYQITDAWYPPEIL